MNGRETALLLQRGVTMATIDALEAAGYDSFTAIMGIPQEKIPLILGAAEEDLRAAVRLVEMLADAKPAVRQSIFGWPGVERPG